MAELVKRNWEKAVKELDFHFKCCGESFELIYQIEQVLMIVGEINGAVVRAFWVDENTLKVEIWNRNNPRKYTGPCHGAFELIID
jgi:hypothetical protein